MATISLPFETLVLRLGITFIRSGQSFESCNECSESVHETVEITRSIKFCHNKTSYLEDTSSEFGCVKYSSFDIAFSVAAFMQASNKLAPAFAAFAIVMKLNAE